ITSTDNKEVKYAASLLQKKYRDRENRFLAEGSKTIEAADRRTIECVFIDKDRLNDYQSFLEDMDSKCYAVDQRLIRKICDTDTPQGIVAVVKKPEAEIADLLNNQKLLIMLDRITDPGNMGTIIRSAWALQVGGVLVGSGSVDPFSPKVVRATMGGIFNVAIAVNVDQAQIASCHEKGFKLVCTDISAIRSFYDINYSDNIIIIIGNEAAGVSKEIKTVCDEFIKIPVNPMADSLNAGVACAIIMQEAYRQRSKDSFLY
ncbi:MAG TPA: RNA methyltransferase, partial [Syntrophomonadaceae bacterium]|nr:RNA methyltransferase [Syntrophomonadaceae bacterium]